MPSNPRNRRTRIPRRLPPRPTISGTAAPVVPDTPGAAPQARTRAQTERMMRSSRLIERETPYVMRELRRVAGVSVVTFGLLFVLAIISHVR